MDEMIMPFHRTVFLPKGSPGISLINEIQADIRTQEITSDNGKIFCRGELDILIDYISQEAEEEKNRQGIFSGDESQIPESIAWQALLTLPFCMTKKGSLPYAPLCKLHINTLEWQMVAPRALEMHMGILILKPGEEAPWVRDDDGLGTMPWQMEAINSPSNQEEDWKMENLDNASYFTKEGNKAFADEERYKTMTKKTTRKSNTVKGNVGYRAETKSTSSESSMPKEMKYGKEESAAWEEVSLCEEKAKIYPQQKGKVCPEEELVCPGKGGESWEEISGCLDAPDKVECKYKAAEKPMEKAAEKPMEKAAEKPMEKAAENPMEKAAEKPMEKAAEKPMEKAAEKPMEKAAEKPMEKAAEKPMEKTIINVKIKNEHKYDPNKEMAAEEENIHGNIMAAEEENIHGNIMAAEEENIHGNIMAAEEENIHGNIMAAEEENIHGNIMAAEEENILGEENLLEGLENINKAIENKMAQKKTSEKIMGIEKEVNKAGKQEAASEKEMHMAPGKTLSAMDERQKGLEEKRLGELERQRGLEEKRLGELERQRGLEEKRLGELERQKGLEAQRMGKEVPANSKMQSGINKEIAIQKENAAAKKSSSMSFYRVQSGEDLISIALKLGVSPQRLAERNKIGMDDVKAGMLLIIPR